MTASGKTPMNLYAVLEIVQTSTEAQIKHAWHEQLQVWHPDRFAHAPELHEKATARTQLINQAYHTLSDRQARARYDATLVAAPRPTAPPSRSAAPQTAPAYATPPGSRPAGAARPAAATSGPRGPQTPLMLSRVGAPKRMVPAITILVDPTEPQPYEFDDFVRIAGTLQQPLVGGHYAIAEAPDIFRVERRRIEDFNTIFSNPSDNRPRFLAQLEPLLAVPARFLLVEGTMPAQAGPARLAQYHKRGLQDFQDALTARFGLQLIFADTREEAEERLANLAATYYAYWWAEQQGLGRCLIEDDL
ncbi:MAG: DnaJ domain-containing protein [Nitrospiraceae bacterium]